jgi:uncharacterized membrane protein
MILILILCVAAIAAQVWLSGRENKWVGLILPVLSFLLTVATAMLMVIRDGENVALTVAAFILWANIPTTLVLLGIYFGIRYSKKRKKEIEKMEKLDL